MADINMYNVVVIISSYNGEKHIQKQLDSICKQKNVNISIYIRDDHSLDRTIKVIEKYKEKNRKVPIYIEQGEDNLGYAKSFWTALKNAPEADYYAFADQDDIWKPEKLQKSIDIMTAEPDIPQLSYCKMQRSDEKLRRLNEQIEVMKPEELSKKRVLIKTYNYGAATVINSQARKLICRCWPKIEDLPHDMWFGAICYWFGKVYYVDEELYYWIRYNTSVTGEGTKKTGIIYRIKKSLAGKSYPNICQDILNNYSDLIEIEDLDFLRYAVYYKSNFKYKCKLLSDRGFKRTSVSGTIALKLGILFNWY